MDNQQAQEGALPTPRPARCPNCSSRTKPSDRFCAQCGTSLTSPPAPGALPIEYERFFELAVDVFVVTGPNGMFEQVNPAMARLLGVDREVILSNPWSEFVHPDDRERSAEEFARELALGHRTVTFENRYVDAEGTSHWMDWSAELDAATGLVYGIARDVTDRRAEHAALIEARATAETANRAKSEFLSRMSHELRTPLNAVLGFAQVLGFDDLTDAQRETVEQITRGGHRLLDLIDEVLDISKIEIGAVTISVEPVLVAEVVADVMSLLGPNATGHGLALRSALADGEATYVLADRRRLHQVLVNYVSNAIKYTPSGGSATIGARPAANGWLRIFVTDDGPGIPAESLERLFVPFERLGAEATEIEGTGLGLAHSKALVQWMGGRIGVDTVVGRGSEFWLELPIAEALFDGDVETLLAPQAADAPRTVGTVLYVEDNPSNLRLMEQVVTLRPGIRLMSASRGRRGIEIAREAIPDLVVLDLHLPDIPGETVLTELRSDPRTMDIPIVILSADATRVHIEELLALGAQGYLTKPFDVQAFLAIVDDHLARRRR